MIYSLTGKVVALDRNGLAVQCGGIAFFCFSTIKRFSIYKSFKIYYSYVFWLYWSIFYSNNS